MTTHVTPNLLRALLALSTLAAVTVAQAGNVNTVMEVSAEVPAACTVSAAPLSFGVLSSTLGKQASTDITVNCPTSVPYNIALDAGQNPDGDARRVTNGSGAFVTYGLYGDASLAPGSLWGDKSFGDTYFTGSTKSGTGDGTDQSHAVFGAMNLYGSNPPGTYTDQVVVTVHF
jgi:spore coat protein U-like protein